MYLSCRADLYYSCHHSKHEFGIFLARNFLATAPLTMVLPFPLLAFRPRFKVLQWILRNADY
uniref:Uncharacterized protein n=1 Tax=Megaselia scalaris TaxID=36166 RepID=T1GEF7_MEGSC